MFFLLGDPTEEEREQIRRLRHSIYNLPVKLSSNKSRIPVKKERERELHEQIALHWNEQKIHINKLAADIITSEVRNEHGILKHVQTFSSYHRFKKKSTNQGH